MLYTRSLDVVSTSERAFSNMHQVLRARTNVNGYISRAPATFHGSRGFRLVNLETGSVRLHIRSRLFHNKVCGVNKCAAIVAWFRASFSMTPEYYRDQAQRQAQSPNVNVYLL